MKGYIKDADLVDDAREPRWVEKGTKVVIKESFWMHTVEIQNEDGTTRLEDIAAEYVFIFCEVPGCKREHQYDHPKFWCEEHWDEWMNFAGEESEEPEWMRLEE